MKRIRLVGALVLALIAVVLILQNTEPVETRLLFATVIMPQSILLLITTLVGFAAGILMSLYWSHKANRAAKKERGRSAGAD